MTRRTLWNLLPGLALLLAFGAQPGFGEEARVAIRGYDPVAYFTDGKPTPGRPDVGYVWHNAHWLFASTAHRDLFVHDPEHYAPQYDGYCAMGAASGAEAHKDLVNPQTWVIVDGKLYLTHSVEALAKWQKSPTENIKRADSDWPRVQKQAVVYDGYPNPAK